MQETVSTASGVPLVTTAETAAVTSQPVGYGGPVGAGYGLAVHGYVNVTAGTGTTAMSIAVRKGAGTGGQLLATADVDTLAAGSSESIPYEFIDSNPIVTPAGTVTGADVAGANLYTVTVAQVGATGNGTINHASIGVRPIAIGW